MVLKQTGGSEMPTASRDAIWPMIKVCGVRELGNLSMLKDTGVNAIGINLVPQSPRRVTLAQAQALSLGARDQGLLSVAVVRDPDQALLSDVVGKSHVDLIQLHGHEEPSLLEQFPQCGFIKALSWSGRAREQELAGGWQEAALKLHPAAKWASTRGLVAFLVDAFEPVMGGGSGKLARWDLLQPRPNELQDRPLILAGGLHASNVAEAITKVRPDGVDAASGVEVSPGIKSPEKTRAFASNARAAFATLATE